MTSQQGRPSPVARRALLGTALSGAAVAALPGTAHAEQAVRAAGTVGAGPVDVGVGRPWKLRDTMTTDAA